MEKLNYNTKKAQRYISLFWKSHYDSIDDCYKTGASVAKRHAEAIIKYEMNKRNGYRYRIISHDHFRFTCAYIANDNLIVRTPTAAYQIDNILLPF